MENIVKKVEETYSETTKIDQYLYSKQAIRGFSVFFTTIFGGVLLMQNLKQVGKKKEAYISILFSIAYTIISILIVNIPEKPITSITIFINMIGGYLLIYLFEEKHIPNKSEYKNKKILKPFIISILIMIPFILAMIFC